MEYKILEEKVVYNGGHGKKMFQATIKLPNGKVVEWDVNGGNDFAFAATVKDGMAYMTKEWRLGPRNYLTQFTGAQFSENEKEALSELKREVSEELGIVGGKYKELISFTRGTHTRGSETYYLVTDFEITGETKRDLNEFQELVILPVKGLFNELKKNHIVTAGTLLAAKLLEEIYN